MLAIGHSARDTIQMLCEKKLPMEAKAFAVGFRMEHRQEMINKAMYGEDCPYAMGAAPYKVTHKCENGRGVYSFCMCPGGYVVNASSEEGRTAVNGMSYRRRDSENANSAIVVTVSPKIIMRKIHCRELNSRGNWKARLTVQEREVSRCSALRISAVMRRLPDSDPYTR